MGLFFNRLAKGAKRPADEPRPVSPDAVRRRLVFGGACQGVGFRYTSADVANALDLSGWVRNELDGTVLMEIQGPAELIGQFLTRLQNAYRRLPSIQFYVQDMEELPVEPDETSFRVRY